MRRNVSIDLGFWGRIALTSLVVNVPLALGLLVYGMHLVLAFALSAAAGVAVLAIWDGSRRASEPSGGMRLTSVEASLYGSSVAPLGGASSSRNDLSIRSTSESLSSRLVP